LIYVNMLMKLVCGRSDGQGFVRQGRNACEHVQ
jgi:hypothetical protein